MKLGEPSHPAPCKQVVVLRQALANLGSREQQPPALYPNQQKHYAETMRGKSHHKRFALVRLAWNAVAPTILKTSGSGGHMHPDEPRLLDTSELKRLAAFPDGFNFAGNWNATVNRIGNSVPPPIYARHR